MSNYYIHIDSSTQKKNNITYGPSTVAWTIISNGEYPYRAGIMYSHLNGPNEIIYEGILSAISSIEARNLLNTINNRIVFYIDSTSVINQINGLSSTRNKLTKNLSLLKKKISEYNNTKFEFKYKNEKDKDFKQADTLSKLAKNNFFYSAIGNLKK